MNARPVSVEETGFGRVMAAMLWVPEKTCQPGTTSVNSFHFVA